MYGYHVNLTIKSQHLLRNRNPDSAKLRKHNVKERRINDACQYQYWKAKVFTKATIKYGYPSKRRRLLSTDHIKTEHSQRHQRRQGWYGYEKTKVLQMNHAHHHQHMYHAKEQSHKNLPRRG